MARMISLCVSFSIGRSPPRIQMMFGVVLVSLAEPRAVDLGVLRREDLRPGAALDVPFVAPRRQEADVDPERSRLVHDEVHVVPVVVVGAVFARRASRGRC